MAGMTLVTVTNIVDGDTIDVLIDGQEQRIRIIGVDTPETKDPNQPVMCFGAEATAFTVQMIQMAGNEVYLEKDVSETDRYDRLLRYVWLPHDDGTRMLNQELVAQGYAQSSTYPPDVKYQDLFVEAQQQARAEGRGLWGTCGEFGVPLATPKPVRQPPTPTAVPQPAATPVPVAPEPPPATGGCDPSYPDFCLEPGIPDLDCGDIPYGRFTVLPPDPHGFDGNDNDGLGCESN
jgi:micrococcal nuclease